MRALTRSDTKPKIETAGKLIFLTWRGSLSRSRGGRTDAAKGHSEEKIMYALRQVEAGKTVSEVCREMAVSPQAFYSWKRRYAGLGLSEPRELRQLREEN
jgi:hypothetical protein